MSQSKMKRERERERVTEGRTEERVENNDKSFDGGYLYVEVHFSSRPWMKAPQPNRTE